MDFERQIPMFILSNKFVMSSFNLWKEEQGVTIGGSPMKIRLLLLKNSRFMDSSSRQ